MPFGQCFMCREYSSEAIVRNGTMGVRLCYPCWDDVVRVAEERFLVAGGRQSASEGLRGRPDMSVPLLRPTFE